MLHHQQRTIAEVGGSNNQLQKSARTQHTFSVHSINCTSQNKHKTPHIPTHKMRQPRQCVSLSPAWPPGWSSCSRWSSLRPVPRSASARPSGRLTRACAPGGGSACPVGAAWRWRGAGRRTRRGGRGAEMKIGLKFPCAVVVRENICIVRSNKINKDQS